MWARNVYRVVAVVFAAVVVIAAVVACLLLLLLFYRPSNRKIRRIKTKTVNLKEPLIVFTFFIFKKKF